MGMAAIKTAMIETIIIAGGTIIIIAGVATATVTVEVGTIIAPLGVTTREIIGDIMIAMIREEGLPRAPPTTIRTAMILGGKETKGNKANGASRIGTSMSTRMPTVWTIQ